MNLKSKLSYFLFENIPSWRAWRSKKFWQSHKLSYIDSSTPLTEEQIKELKEYWDRYLKIDDILHRFYTQKTGTFHVNYLPDEVYYYYIDRFYNNEDLARWLDDKSLYTSLLIDSENLVKHPENVAFRSGGYWITPEFTPLTESQVVDRIKKAGEVFVKESVDSCGGHGVQFINAGKLSNTEICNKLQQGGGNIVIQKKIIQHDLLSKLNPSSVNTLRVLSFLKPDGEVKIYSVVLRMGLAGAVVDNASSGGITVGVQNDGRLKSVAYTANGDKFDKVHPDSKVEFSSIVVPKYHEITEAVKRLHLRLPRLRLLSWDFAIDCDETPILIEVNMNRGELDFHQLNNGPLFGEDTETILNEVFGK